MEGQALPSKHRTLATSYTGRTGPAPGCPLRSLWHFIHSDSHLGAPIILVRGCKAKC